MLTPKEHAKKIVDELDDDMSFEDVAKKVLYELKYRQHILKLVEAGERDIAEGRTYSSEEVAEKLGIKL